MTTGALRTRPVVTSLCAYAAIGALTAPAMATMASSLFRIMNSFAAGCSACFRTRAIPPNSSRAASFPKTCGSHRPDLRHFQPSEWNLLKRQASSIPEPCQRVSCRPRFAFHTSRRHSMTITAVQIPAIVALLAGFLILIMPRFLNFIVAIYLILVGLHGLGIFRSLHM
jgi:hypothetical protein